MPIARPPWPPRSRSLRTVVAVNLSAAALSACGGGNSSTSVALPPGCQHVAEPQPKHVDLRRPASRVSPSSKLTARVETSCGTFSVALGVKSAPRTVGSFAYLARRGVYDGTSFQRIVPGFLIQGGDPSETGSGGPGYSITEPPPPGTRYTKGTVAMAKSAVEPPGTSQSQFFVVTAADTGLAPSYAVLGKVSAGWAVVRRIESLGDRASGQAGTPRAPVGIRKVTVRSR
jgi:peptidyl-prolyl cis-trans isomerase B (cyclophilin B)